MKLRLTYSKTGLLRFISHRDLMRIFFRAFRRAAYPLRYSQGFNPHPQVEFCPPLKVGMEGLNELLDVQLSQDFDPTVAGEQLQKELPEGMTIKDIRILGNGAPPLGKSIREAEYQVQLPSDWGIRRERIESFRASREIWLQRKKKDQTENVEIRKGVFELKLAEAISEEQPSLLLLRLQKNMRPQDVLVFLTGKNPENLNGLSWRRLRFRGPGLDETNSTNINF